MKHIALLTLVLFTAACGRIETGNVGVRTEFNRSINTTELQPGWYGAFLTSVDEYSAKEIEVVENDMKPKAKDNLSLQDLDISVFYRVNAEQVAEKLIKYVGMTPYDNAHGVYLPLYNLVDRNTRSVVYDLIGSKYDSLSAHQHRTEIENDAHAQLQAVLDASDPGTFTVTKVIVRQLTTDPALENSIRQAVQVQKEIEAKKQQVDLAHAEAERLRVEAEGQAAANRAINSSLTPMLVELRRIDMQRELAKEGTHTLFIDTKSPIMFGGAK